VVRRPVAWILTVVLFVEAFGIAALNWFLGIVADRQSMSLAGIDPDTMSVSSKVGGIVFGLYFILCALVALLVALRDRAPAGLGRILLISVAVVHGLLGAFAWSMVVVLGLVILLLMTYDRLEGPSDAAPAQDGPTDPKDPKAPERPDRDPAPIAPPPAPSPS
jgi:bacteriorhodopsin